MNFAIYQGDGNTFIQPPPTFPFPRELQPAPWLVPPPLRELRPAPWPVRPPLRELRPAPGPVQAPLRELNVNTVVLPPRARGRQRNRGGRRGRPRGSKIPPPQKPPAPAPESEPNVRRNPTRQRTLPARLQSADALPSPLTTLPPRATERQSSPDGRSGHPGQNKSPPPQQPPTTAPDSEPKPKREKESYAVAKPTSPVPSARSHSADALPPLPPASL